MPVASSVFLALSCTSFKVSGLILRFLNHLDLILAQVKDLDLVSVFCMKISSFPATFVEEAYLPPSYVFGAFVKNQVSVAA
jgi:hypothetical protein